MSEPMENAARELIYLLRCALNCHTPEQARVDIRNLPNVYEGPGPVLHAESMEITDAPAQEVATFY